MPQRPPAAAAGVAGAVVGATRIFAGPAGTAAFAATPDWAVFPRLRSAPAAEDLERAVALLSAARKPMIVAGGGALYAEAGPQIQQLAERLRAPFATTVNGKGVVPETHPLSVGVAGRFGVPMANSILQDADCVIFIGSKTGQTTTNGWTQPRPQTPVIHIDIDPDEIGRNFHNTIGLLADARVGTRALVQALDGLTPSTRWDPRHIAEVRRAWWDGEVQYREEPKPGVLKPQEMVRRMRAFMGEHDVMVTDASLASGWPAGRWQTNRMGRQFFAPRGLAGLGWGLPAAIGVATAMRQSESTGRVVCLAGDGGWGYSMADVETAS